MRFQGLFRKIISIFLSAIFVAVSCLPQAEAQSLSSFSSAANHLTITPAFRPLMIKGLTIDKNDPFRFEFLMKSGDAHLEDKTFEEESYKMIRYFLASLSIPESEMWVNLSPYEHDRIIPETFGTTGMGRDLLAQDYILKQLTSSLMSPEDETGKKFWEKVYEKLYASGIWDSAAGDKQQPNANDQMLNAVQTFNKVWIVPQTGYFYEHDNTVFIADAKLKVMLEEDYWAREKDLSLRGSEATKQSQKDGIASQRTLAMTEETKNIIREIIIPVIEKEVNEGEHFANLRQIYNAMLLSVWFKKRLKEHVLGQVYMNQGKVNGEVDRSAIDQIWQKYVEAFKSGASDVIREEYDPQTQSVIPRKYFTGGAVALDKAEVVNAEEIMNDGLPERRVEWSVGDAAMMGVVKKQVNKAYLALERNGLLSYFVSEGQFKDILKKVMVLQLKDLETYLPRIRTILGKVFINLSEENINELVNVAKFLNSSHFYNNKMDLGLKNYHKIETYFQSVSGQVLPGSAYRWAVRYHLKEAAAIKFMAKKYNVQFEVPVNIDKWIKELRSSNHPAELPYTIEEIFLMFPERHRLKKDYSRETLSAVIESEQIIGGVVKSKKDPSFYTPTIQGKLEKAGFHPLQGGNLSERILIRIAEYEFDEERKAEEVLGENYQGLIALLGFDVQRVLFIYRDIDRMMLDLRNYLDRLRGIYRSQEIERLEGFFREFIRDRHKVFYRRKSQGLLSKHRANVDFLGRLTSRELAQHYGLSLDDAVRALDRLINPTVIKPGSIEEWAFHHPFISIGEKDKDRISLKYRGNQPQVYFSRLLFNFGIVVMNELGPFLSDADLEIPQKNDAMLSEFATEDHFYLWLLWKSLREAGSPIAEFYKDDVTAVLSAPVGGTDHLQRLISLFEPFQGNYQFFHLGSRGAINATSEAMQWRGVLAYGFVQPFFNSDYFVNSSQGYRYFFIPGLRYEAYVQYQQAVQEMKERLADYLHKYAKDDVDAEEDLLARSVDELWDLAVSHGPSLADSTDRSWAQEEKYLQNQSLFDDEYFYRMPDGFGYQYDPAENQTSFMMVVPDELGIFNQVTFAMKGNFERIIYDFDAAFAASLVLRKIKNILGEESEDEAMMSFHKTEEHFYAELLFKELEKLSVVGFGVEEALEDPFLSGKVLQGVIESMEKVLERLKQNPFQIISLLRYNAEMLDGQNKSLVKKELTRYLELYDPKFSNRRADVLKMNVDQLWEEVERLKPTYSKDMKEILGQNPGLAFQLMDLTESLPISGWGFIKNKTRFDMFDWNEDGVFKDLSFSINGNISIIFHHFGFEFSRALAIRALKKRMKQEGEDFAMMARVIGVLVKTKKEWHQGGINLRSDQADIQIQASENGFQFPRIDPAMLEHPIEKLVPRIINISPIQPQEAMQLLGLNRDPAPSQSDHAHSAKSVDLTAVKDDV